MQALNNTMLREQRTTAQLQKGSCGVTSDGVPSVTRWARDESSGMACRVSRDANGVPCFTISSVVAPRLMNDRRSVRSYKRRLLFGSSGLTG